MTMRPPHISGAESPEFDRSLLSQLIQCIDRELLTQIHLKSSSTHNPVVVEQVPIPWQLLGAGNYAAVFAHPDYPQQVVKIYAPGLAGFEEETEVYRRLGAHPAFSECLYAGANFLVLKRLDGATLYDSVQQGLSIPEQVIQDIDRALDYARAQGLNPFDVHGRNVMMFEGKGYVVDVSDFLHPGTCPKWRHLKQAYYWLYCPIIRPLKLRIPYSLLNVVRKSYRYVRSHLL
ncbi:serine/threonine protein kinase [Chamaesiphon sp.]|uniref:serine/threonine protein kinase n=1 Tax=Chamaesiphon sp. TaxID=2814140 RepID=UPI0035946F96